MEDVKDPGFIGLLNARSGQKDRRAARASQRHRLAIFANVLKIDVRHRNTVFEHRAQLMQRTAQNRKLRRCQAS
jgi:hypothetical protein